MLEKIKSLLKDKNGFANTIEMMGVSLLLAMLTIAGITLSGYIHNVTVLDRFADEMVAKAALEGKCRGTEIDARYEELAKSTGIRPDISFTAPYYDHAKQTVQYGDAITISAQIEVPIIGFGDFVIRDTPTRRSTGQSMQYWK